MINFDPQIYKHLNEDLRHMNDLGATLHYKNEGIIC
jgi:hypothetical protein